MIGVIQDIDYAMREIKMSGSGITSVIAYDSGTLVEEEGVRMRADELRTGDLIAVRVSRFSGRYVADRIRVLEKSRR
jgi:hypothetical protein